jgi:hypothetical protein
MILSVTLAMTAPILWITTRAVLHARAMGTRRTDNV